jgi:hypothetical protein
MLLLGAGRGRATTRRRRVPGFPGPSAPSLGGPAAAVGSTRAEMVQAVTRPVAGAAADVRGVLNILAVILHSDGPCDPGNPCHGRPGRAVRCGVPRLAARPTSGMSQVLVIDRETGGGVAIGRYARVSVRSLMKGRPTPAPTSSIVDRPVIDAGKRVAYARSTSSILKPAESWMEAIGGLRAQLDLVAGGSSTDVIGWPTPVRPARSLAVRVLNAGGSGPTPAARYCSRPVLD